MIHPQAIVDPGAQIGKNVRIGAFSVIGPGVEIDDATWIGPHVVINGPTRIGKNNRIYQFSSLGEAPQHLGYQGEPTRLEIGDRNIIREYCTFNRGTAAGGGVTRLGDDNFIMAYCHVAHDCRVGHRTIFANGTSLAGHAIVEDYVIFGGFTMVHQFCRVGAHTMTGISTVTFKDIPPYLLVAGNTAVPHGLNLRGLKRRQFSESAIESLRRAYKILYKSGLRLNEALAQIEAIGKECAEVRHLADFIKSSERGVIR
ncbi:MAG: acyl-[acyl-carrier-protein]--UDP-N-acetylglucosamine O-acyltransferase [Candidatus Muproteobacteria bacterium RIFCSPHIGHO2_02_FULL_60_13]|uniref:Acyl-[acyl-carrier-protein]--UDP-N-acetylglucosamine O-acyltransferase n=1 Tax=Candidatus Muproteobacteria bacterium RIFCSPLOWO2_01_FULL_60_18 TaxID=1817768 RepID=A0A1F6U022_9PROT|nr:MAG: acyl-[acyl-carrier-protein]--UDP-N-acetylglucosamine O-acyltransferase [Candidatus Muproteobacteria bacterium RIFCSPLOWO2_01_FULL_60_18]OGI53224.1 MAG: acyl-[acyl-carrier-protein]--UDP-N-acetylglucosamine O-acyltransferase [Candidatus Muproteobacteria bacterium RIFCSPHIGHO2_01_60_12]OGI56342.1 MAG: acyl-[acyl-carrier-protein]--UDP-N-acetylglucosamine O-acyltransferase [Candidatus Muproteobacteria bacterium RIFCSPHIGHO2_02_FULL_60_13]